MGAQGYIGSAPGDSSVIVARQTFTPTGITTNFTFASGYTVGYVDAYLNGARLVEGDDYTATTGTTVVLVQAASLNDIVEMVVYDTFSVANSYTKTESDTRYPFKGNNSIIRLNGQTISADITIDSDENGVSAGPITINSGVTLTIPAGSTYTVV